MEPTNGTQLAQLLQLLQVQAPCSGSMASQQHLAKLYAGSHLQQTASACAETQDAAAAGAAAILLRAEDGSAGCPQVLAVRGEIKPAGQCVCKQTTAVCLCIAALTAGTAVHRQHCVWVAQLTVWYSFEMSCQPDGAAAIYTRCCSKRRPCATPATLGANTEDMLTSRIPAHWFQWTALLPGCAQQICSRLRHHPQVHSRGQLPCCCHQSSLPHRLFCVVCPCCCCCWSCLAVAPSPACTAEWCCTPAPCHLCHHRTTGACRLV